ncbi:MAG: hypothetical protein ACK5XN_27340 [Bacteroidota bacterium]
MPPSETFPLAVVNDHLFVDLGHGASVLVDTGSSISLGDIKSVTTPLDPALLPPGLRNLLPQVSDKIGVQVTGILGRDWLMRRRFDLDLRREGAFVLRRHGPEVQLSDRQAIASLQLDITLAGTTHRAFVDTGAPIAYVIDLPDNITPNPIRLRDFTLLSGSLESFEVAAYLIVVLLSQFTPSSRSLRAARPPEAVRKAIQAIGCTAIVGLPLLRGSLTRWTPENGLQIASRGLPRPPRSPDLTPRSPLPAPPAIGMAGLLGNLPGDGEPADEPPGSTPIPLSESLQNFWQNVWKAANCEGRALHLADGAGMVVVPSDTPPDWLIRCDLEAAIVSDGANSYLSALARISTDFGTSSAQRARELLRAQGSDLNRILRHLVEEGGSVFLGCDRTDNYLDDLDLLEGPIDIPLRLGARLTLQRAFPFSKEFRQNDPAEIHSLAQTINNLAQLHRQLDA